MPKSILSRSALTKIQTLILVTILLIAAADAVAYLYENNYFGAEQGVQQAASPTPTPIPTAPVATAAPPPTALPTSLRVSDLFVNPIEAWPNQTISATVKVTNAGSGNVSYEFPFSVNGKIVQEVPVQLGAQAIENVTGTFSESSLGSYQLNAGGQAITFTVVTAGMHTLNVILNKIGISFTLDGKTESTPYTALVTVGPHSLTVPASVQLENGMWGLCTFTFTGWDDGTLSTTRTVNVQGEIYVAGTFIRTSPTSCPELYTWNGTGYNYASDVNDGTGWLGFLEYFNPDGSMLFSYNYPYDYIKLDSAQLQPLKGSTT